MSLKTWKAEFYPITAKQAARKPLVVAVEHSLQKWIGLKPANRKNHEVFVGIWSSEIWTEDGNVPITSETCSLCQKFLVKNSTCSGCPIFESRDGVRCDDEADGEDESPYHYWTLDSDPMPMIKALRKALKWAKENS